MRSVPDPKNDVSWHFARCGSLSLVARLNLIYEYACYDVIGYWTVENVHKSKKAYIYMRMICELVFAYKALLAGVDPGFAKGGP